VLRLHFRCDIPGQDEHIVRMRLGQTLRRQYRDVAARHELSLLGRCGITYQAQQIHFDTRIVQQGVSLGGRAIGDDRATRTLLFDEE
jgi:hypothetical protein